VREALGDRQQLREEAPARLEFLREVENKAHCGRAPHFREGDDRGRVDYTLKDTHEFLTAHVSVDLHYFVTQILCRGALVQVARPFEERREEGVKRLLVTREQNGDVRMIWRCASRVQGRVREPAMEHDVKHTSKQGNNDRSQHKDTRV
jgi:hypothetical protein